MSAAQVVDVIAGRETAGLEARFAAEIGPDLQVIRINGAVLDALIGGIIFTANAILVQLNIRESEMKITMNIDCTPEEARAFLGLPDLKPMQDELMQEMRERMTVGIRAMDPADMLRHWMPGMVGLEQMRDVFSAMTSGKRDK